MKKVIPAIVGALIVGSAALLWLVFSGDKEVAYWNNLTGGYYYGTNEDLYIFLKVLKMEEAGRSASREPQFNYSWPKHLIYMVHISADGKNDGFTILDDGGFHNINCAEYALFQHVPIAFDCRKIYRLEARRLIVTAIDELPAALQKEVENARRHDESGVKEFNRNQGVVDEGEIPQFSFSSTVKNFDWLGHRFAITTKRADNGTELTISAGDIMTAPIRIQVPDDRIPFGPHRDPEPGFGPIQYTPGSFRGEVKKTED